MKKEEKESDVVFENENEDVGGFSSKNKKEEKIKEKIKNLEEERNEYLDGWQRARAEMVNLKKNHIEEKKNFSSLGKENIISEILPVLDNFNAAFSNKEAWEKVDEAWRKGIEYIYSNFEIILENNGCISFGKVGDDFNEEKHLSIENIETGNDSEAGKVAEIIQKGYMIEKKILREAKVKVFVKR